MTTTIDAIKGFFAFWLTVGRSTVRLWLEAQVFVHAAALAFFTGESSFTEPTGSIAAAAVVVTVPIIVFVLFFQRRIVSGLTAGAVKG